MESIFKGFNTEVSQQGNQNTIFVSLALGWLKFLCINRDRPGVFTSTYLHIRGWDESRIGHLTFLRSIVSLSVQTPLGDLVDKSTWKREFLGLGCLLTAIVGLIFISNSDNFSSVCVGMLIQGVTIAVIAPAMYGLTLGMVGPTNIMRQTSINEACDHAGTVVFAIIAGLLAYVYGDSKALFWMVFIMACFTALSLCMIHPQLIDHNRARGKRIQVEVEVDVGLYSSLQLQEMTKGDIDNDNDNGSGNNTAAAVASYTQREDNDNDNDRDEGEDDEETETRKEVNKPKFHPSSTLSVPSSVPVAYTEILSHKETSALLAIAFFFQLGNGAMLPLVAQTLVSMQYDAGLPLAAVCIIISQATMVPITSWIGSSHGQSQSQGHSKGSHSQRRFSLRHIFIFGLSMVPLRGLVIMLTLSEGGSTGVLLATQIFDGLATGIYTVLSVLLTERLTRGSGRFNFLFGLVNSAQILGDALSNLCAQHVADVYGYVVAFFILTIISFIPIYLSVFELHNENDDHQLQHQHVVLDSTTHSDKSVVMEQGKLLMMNIPVVLTTPSPIHNNNNNNTSGGGGSHFPKSSSSSSVSSLLSLGKWTATAAGKTSSSLIAATSEWNRLPSADAEMDLVQGQVQVQVPPSVAMDEKYNNNNNNNNDSNNNHSRSSSNGSNSMLLSSSSASSMITETKPTKT
eukprot:gene10317-21534_t